MSLVAVVTGGTRGIGRATVQRLLADGLLVCFCGRDKDAGARVLAELGEPERTAFVAADVADEADVRAVVAACLDRLGPPSVLVANAGVNANYDAVAMTTGEWDEFFAVDLRSAWLFAKHVLPHML